MEIPRGTYNGAGIYFIRYRKDKGQREWDDKIYIGSSRHIKQRLYQHLTQLRAGIHCGEAFQNDFTSDPDGKWWCGVVRKMEGATDKELRLAESEEIAKIPERQLYNVAKVDGFIRPEGAESREAFAKKYFKNQTIRQLMSLLATEERIVNSLVNCKDNPKEKAIKAAEEAFLEAIEYFKSHA